MSSADRPRSYRTGLAYGLQTGGFVVIVLAFAKLITNFVSAIAIGSQDAWQRFSHDAPLPLVEVALAGIMIAVSPRMAHVKPSDARTRWVMAGLGIVLLIAAIVIIWTNQKA